MTKGEMFFKDCKTIDELKVQYKKLALIFHPDRPTGNVETMKLINAAY